jgi:hypothetical protein
MCKTVGEYLESIATKNCSNTPNSPIIPHIVATMHGRSCRCPEAPHPHVRVALADCKMLRASDWASSVNGAGEPKTTNR